MVLDLHLPKRSAREILVTLQAEEKLLKMPVVVLTSLISEQEKLSLLALGVHEILIKPAELDGYFKLARQLAALYV